MFRYRCPHCRQILQADPQRHQALHLLGVIICGGRRFEEGHRLLSAAISLQPDSVEYRLNYGLALMSRNPVWIRVNMPASLGKPFYPGS